MLIWQRKGIILPFRVIKNRRRFRKSDFDVAHEHGRDDPFRIPQQNRQARQGLKGFGGTASQHLPRDARAQRAGGARGAARAPDQIAGGAASRDRGELSGRKQLRNQKQRREKAEVTVFNFSTPRNMRPFLRPKSQKMEFFYVKL